VAIGLDINILCYGLNSHYPEYEKVKDLLFILSPKKLVALNPTVLHETYHTIVYYSEWVPEEAARRLTALLRHPYIEFYNQTKNLTNPLNLAVKYDLDGRDALITANYIAKKIPIMYAHDKARLKIQKISWKNSNLTYKRPTDLIQSWS
jgi:predicted nucleic acid-binding protein